MTTLSFLSPDPPPPFGEGSGEGVGESLVRVKRYAKGTCDGFSWTTPLLPSIRRWSTSARKGLHVSVLDSRLRGWASKARPMTASQHGPSGDQAGWLASARPGIQTGLVWTQMRRGEAHDDEHRGIIHSSIATRGTSPWEERSTDSQLTRDNGRTILFRDHANAVWRIGPSTTTSHTFQMHQEAHTPRAPTPSPDTRTCNKLRSVNWLTG